MSKKHIYDDNVKGDFYVHDTCIACDTCTDIAPKNFKLTDDYDHAIVYNQPHSSDDISHCNQAIDACPVGAIEKQ
ncbi:ferredoxin [Candidatus Marinamargulisbacteria bacterium SCGC AG-333-B06]|nr:ferredoxin [Candidatus Marinamargulisbacteria bacterium SCGC AG-333-B06]